MHILVIGGSGRNGRLVIQEALSHGHTVTALLRSPTSMDTSAMPNATNFTAVKGTPLSKTDVVAALQAPRPPEAVIFALSPRHTGSSAFSPLAPDSPPTLILDALTNLLSSLRSASLSPKIVVNSAQGTGNSWSSLPLVMRLIFRYTSMKVSRDDHDAADKMLRSSGYGFVLARAARLVDNVEGEKKKTVRVWGDDGKGVGFLGSIGRRDLAAWMVEAAASKEWDGLAPVLTSE